MLGAVELLGNGTLLPKSTFALDVGDLPVWMASARTATSQCVFVARPSLNSILSLRVGPDGQLQPDSSSSASSGGHNPVFAAVTLDQRFVLVADYNGPDDATSSAGAAAVSLGIEEDCSLTLADSKPHAGSSVDPQRQRAAHVHAFVPGKGSFAFACDLGMDMIFTYRVLQQPRGALVEISRIRTAPGLGPRHLVVHPMRQDSLYVVCEMGQVVLSFRLDEDGSLALLQTSPLWREEAGHVGKGNGSKAAEIVIKADGTALYVSNRGRENTVTVFAIDNTGLLERKQQIDAPAYPRGMTLACEDSLLVVAGQSKSEVTTFRVLPGGSLEPADRLVSGVPPNPAAFLPLTPGVLGAPRTEAELVV